MRELFSYYQTEETVYDLCRCNGGVPVVGLVRDTQTLIPSATAQAVMGGGALEWYRKTA